MILSNLPTATARWLAWTVLVLLFALGGAAQTWAAESDDLGTQLMHCTFKLTDGQTNGTAFVLTRGEKTGDGKELVLVTAAHALEQMKQDEPTLVARRKTADGSYEKRNVSIAIRKDGKPLYVKHASQDVAALKITLPPEVSVSRLSVDLLASDEMLSGLEVHPGDILRCAGFPHAGQYESSPAGFPLVRMGCLASYPILPSKNTKTFLFDFNTFEGDSGAAVYLDDPRRVVAGQTGEHQARMIVGVVHAQQFIDEAFKTIYQSGQSRHRMGLGIVVHASIVRETIDLLDAAAP